MKQERETGQDRNQQEQQLKDQRQTGSERTSRPEEERTSSKHDADKAESRLSDTSRMPMDSGLKSKTSVAGTDSDGQVE